MSNGGFFRDRPQHIRQEQRQAQQAGETFFSRFIRTSYPFVQSCWYNICAPMGQ